MKSQLEVNSGEELRDMLEDPPIIRNTAASTPATPSMPFGGDICAAKKNKQKRSCLIS